MKKFLTALVLLSVSNCCLAQGNLYSSFTIPESLKKNADVVVRDQKIKFSIRDINNARYEVHQVLTILNEQGKRYLNFHEFSYEFQVLEDAEIMLYDALGVKKSTIAKKEMTSLNYGDGLVPEGKVTYHQITPLAYPFTIEVNYSVKFKGLFNFPTYYFQHAYQSVAQAVFEVEAPASLSFRYKQINNNYKPLIQKEGNKELYTWQVNNLAAFKMENHAGSSDHYLPYILLAPNQFQLSEYDGDMTSWKHFGEWYKKVYLNTSELKPERKLFFIDLVKNAQTDKEKAAILYQYLQQQMRYVSIQLGIGGLKPFPASFVDEKKYGDCKALSNYLKSVLQAVGVKSNVVIIEGGMDPGIVYEDFPAHYFNHVILCIPQPKDTIWLECTSSSLPFGELGPFTENRKAMMITDNGGVLVNTPQSKYDDNTENITTKIEVNEEGGALVKASHTLFGEGRNEMLMQFHDKQEDEKRIFFINYLTWKQPNMMQISNADSKANPYRLQVNMQYEKMYAFNAGSKQFFETRLYPIFDEDITDNTNRVNDYFFNNPYQVVDTTVFIFPPNYQAENIPKNKSVSFPFAQYTSSYNWDATSHTLTVIALLQIKERLISAANYPRLVDFKKQVLADMNEKMVMKKE